MKTLTEKQIDEIFNESGDQIDYTLALYRIAFSDYDNIKTISGYPKVSVETGEYLFDKAIAFDKEKHPDCIAGGLWLNKGFGSNDDVPNWSIDISICQTEFASDGLMPE